MRHVVDVDKWYRKENYLFFRSCLNPNISVTVEVDCTKAYAHAKALGFPVSLYTMYGALSAANAIEEFGYRNEPDGTVVRYDRLSLYTPIGTADNRFIEVVIPYKDTFEEFMSEAQPIVARAKAGDGTVYNAEDNRPDQILISINPWYRFTSVQVAIPKNPHVVVPLFTFGKMTLLENGQRVMPVAINVNHGFIDGYHVGQFFEKFQNYLDQQ